MSGLLEETAPVVVANRYAVMAVSGVKRLESAVDGHGLVLQMLPDNDEWRKYAERMLIFPWDFQWYCGKIIFDVTKVLLDAKAKDGRPNKVSIIVHKQSVILIMCAIIVELIRQGAVLTEDVQIELRMDCIGQEASVRQIARSFGLPDSIKIESGGRLCRAPD